MSPQRLLFWAAIMPVCVALGQTQIERRAGELDLQPHRQEQLQLPVEPLPSQQPSVPEVSPEPPPLSVDERPLWKLLQSGQLDALRGEIEHLRGAYPGWQPPQELMQLLVQAEEALLWELHRQGREEDLHRKIERLRESHPGWAPPSELTELMARTLADRQANAADADIQQAIDGGDRTALLGLARIHGERFHCGRIDFLWGLGDAHSAAGQVQKAFEVYRRIVTQCPDAEQRVATLEHARGRLTDQRVRELLNREQGRAGHSKALRRRLQALDFALDGEAFRAAAGGGKGSALERALAEWAPAIERRRDTGAALEVAWTLLERDRLNSAGDWFARALQWRPQNPDARYGLALVRFRQGKLDAADALLANARDPRQRALRRDVGMAVAAQAQKEGRYAESNRRLDALAAESHGVDREQALMRAWNDYHLEAYDTAASGFLGAYREQADAPAAEGLGLSLERAGRLRDYENLADELGGPLSERWRGTQADRLSRRGLQRAGWALAPGHDPTLANLDSPWLEVGAGRRNKRGDAGSSRLILEQLPFVAGAWYRGDQGVGLTLRRVKLDSGVLPVGTPFGSYAPDKPWVAEPVRALDAGLEPHLWWRREGWLGWHAELGLTPQDGVLDSRLVGGLGLLRQTEAGNWGLELFLEPVRESLLSYVGATDPYTGNAWGRVRRGGGRFVGYARVRDGWGLSGSLELAGYRGEKVADNTGVAISAGLSHDLRLKGLDYLAVGPELSYLGFDKNLSHFTLGHGGYFSPERRFAAGLSAAFQAQHQRFAIRGRLYAGWATQREASSPCFPLGGMESTATGPCADGFPATRGNGWEINGQVTAALRLHSHAQLLLGVSVRDGIDYQDSAFTAGLRVSLDPRPAALSSDLPDSSLESLF